MNSNKQTLIDLVQKSELANGTKDNIIARIQATNEDEAYSALVDTIEEMLISNGIETGELDAEAITNYDNNLEKELRKLEVEAKNITTDAECALTDLASLSLQVEMKAEN